MSTSHSNLKNVLLSYWERYQGRGVGAVLVRGASGSFGVMLLGAAMAFGTNILLARLMGVTQYGIYIYALTWINVLALLCEFGMGTTLLRYVAAYNATGEWGLLRGILVRSVQYVTIISLIIGITGVLIVWVIQDHLKDGQVATFWISFLLLPLLGLTALRVSGLRALKHVIQAALPDSLFRPIVIVIMSGGFFLLVRQELSAPQVMSFNIVGALVAFFVGSLWLIKALPRQIRDTVSEYANAVWVKVSLPLFIVAGMHLVLKRTDVLMVGALQSVEQAGIYAVATRISELVGFGMTAANTIVAPMISELYSTDRIRELQKLMTYAARGIFAFTLVCGIFIVTFGEYVLGMFGDVFVVGYVPLLIILVGHVINSFSGSGGFLMPMTGYQKQYAVIIGIVAIINLVLNAVLIPIMGMNGAAIATVLSIVLWNISMLVFVWYRLNINPTILCKG